MPLKSSQCAFCFAAQDDRLSKLLYKIQKTPLAFAVAQITAEQCVRLAFESTHPVPFKTSMCRTRQQIATESI
ncbi:hypothetical protein CV770_11350 [Bradyrhizobium sp. AC87j1]|nr:hypothetical protein CV770_11350 [Bradyrhizobium sp. AC87j1]